MITLLGPSGMHRGSLPLKGSGQSPAASEDPVDSGLDVQPQSTSPATSQPPGRPPTSSPAGPAPTAPTGAAPGVGSTGPLSSLLHSKAFLTQPGSSLLGSSNSGQSSAFSAAVAAGGSLAAASSAAVGMAGVAAAGAWMGGVAGLLGGALAGGTVAASLRPVGAGKSFLAPLSIRDEVQRLAAAVRGQGNAGSIGEGSTFVMVGGVRVKKRQA